MVLFEQSYHVLAHVVDGVAMPADTRKVPEYYEALLAGIGERVRRKVKIGDESRKLSVVIMPSELVGPDDPYIFLRAEDVRRLSGSTEWGIVEELLSGD